MKFKFDNGDIVKYEHDLFGSGTGAIVGYCKNIDEWIIYPRKMLPRNDYPFMCFTCKTKQLIPTPF